MRKIQRFQHPSGRVIQVIHCAVPVEDVLDTFDLSVALTWWVPTADSKEGALYTKDEEATKAGLFYSLRPASTQRELARIQKYMARGFKYIDRADRDVYLENL